MKENNSKIKKYSCFTDQEQKYYECLSPQKRLYVDFRAQGYDRANSYIMAGFTGNNPAQSGYNLEHRDLGLSELIGILKRENTIKTLDEQDSKLNARIDALAKQQKTENVLSIIENADGETAERIKFYRDVSNGKIKTKKTIREFDGNNKLIKVKVEEIEDVSTKLQARKELDRVLGLNQIVDLGKIDMGDITINIVDASNKDALKDSSNRVDNVVVDNEIIIDAETEN